MYIFPKNVYRRDFFLIKENKLSENIVKFGKKLKILSKMNLIVNSCPMTNI